MRRVSEALAGRASYLTLWPMTRREQQGLGRAGAWDELLAAPEEEWLDVLAAQPDAAENWRALCTRGGYPTPAVALRTAKQRAIWFDGYVRTYLERDLQDLAAISALPDFRRLMRAASLRVGQLLNQTELGRDVAVPQPSVHGWLNLLETSYKLVRLPAYAVNRSKRLIKSPKLYWSDTGVALHLAEDNFHRFLWASAFASSRSGGSRPGTRLAEEVVAPLAPGEHRTVILDAGGDERTIVGRVVDPEGATRAGATILLLEPGGHGRDDTTDAEDRFAQYQREGGIALRASLYGYHVAALEEPQPDSPVELVLRPLRVVRAHEGIPDVLVLSGLPRKDLTVHATAAGRTFERTLPADATELSIEVPAWGALEVALPTGVGAAHLRLRPRDVRWRLRRGCATRRRERRAGAGHRARARRGARRLERAPGPGAALAVSCCRGVRRARARQRVAWRAMLARRLLPLALAAGALAAWLALRGGDRDATVAPRAEAPHAEESHDARGPVPPLDRSVGDAEAELAPAEGGERVAAVAQVELVLQADGAPFAGVAWVAFRGDGVLASGTTAEDGRARVPLGASEPFELAAVHAGSAPLLREVDPAPAQQRIALDGGSAIAGTVRVDGAPPEGPLRLRLAGDAPFWRADELPEPAAVALLRRARPVASLAVTTDASGAFRFAGLPPGWRGRLSWTELRLAGSTEPTVRAGVDVVAPREGLVLELERPPHVTGIVVHPETGAPVRNPTVQSSWSRADTSSSVMGTYDEDGTFRLSFPGGLPARLELQVGDGGRVRTHVVEIPPGVRRWDTGPLAIARTRVVAFEVTDVDGAPVEGARVHGVSADGLMEEGARSDASGEGDLKVPASWIAIEAQAQGYEPARAALPPPGAAEAVLFRLVPAAVLELVLPEEARALGVELFAPAEPFVKDGAPSWMPQVSPRYSGRTNLAEEGFVRYTNAPDGRYLFAGLRTGVALHVAAVDAAGTRVGARVLQPLAPGEQRVVALEVASELRTLAGRVVTTSGEPVPRAGVMLGAVGDESSQGHPADDEGRFRFEGLAADAVMLVVRAEGYPVHRLPRQPVVDTPIEVVLERGREVAILVVDADGEPVPGLWIEPLHTRDRWWSGSALQREPGVYVAVDAPHGPVPFEVHAGGRRFPGEVAAGAGAARVELPPSQTCTIELTGAVERLEGAHAHVELRALGDTDAGWLSEPVEPGSREVLLPRVFPGRYETVVKEREGDVWAELSGRIVIAVAADAPARARIEVAPRP